MDRFDEEEESLLDKHEVRARRRARFDDNGWLTPFLQHRWLAVWFVIVHLLLGASVIGNVASSLQGTWDGKPFVIFQELRSLRHVVHRSHATNHIAYTKFSGPPNAQNAEAWQHLLQPLYFNASAVELELGGANAAAAVKVKNGGYIAALGVYHEIHCLNKLRSFLYTPQQTPDSNASHVRDNEIEVSTDHLDHCLEVLRMNAMCNPDLSLYTFSWPKEADPEFLIPHSNSPRKCADWSQIEDYGMKRSIGLTPTLLREVDDAKLR
ncbi:hypothetical protein BDV96DRAFT_580343 [Lophiotrema nucula]|uniref:Tat pathway signal sequence n=1 Tax=Lophiotrema nucula TaxID=690887 RepID=A0A6A5Z035_9PLEO|nr:hypothetical protein BDV96DRAFT_580343 [Lophiotrema nucula]